MHILVLYGTLLVGFLVVVLIVFVMEFKKRQNRHYKEKELLNAQFQQELLRTQLEIQEQTFKNISQEIHDNIGQILTLAKLNINTMPEFDSRELQEKILATKELITKAIQDLRDLSKTLNADYVTEMGLIKSIQYELNLLKKIGGLQTDFVQEGTAFTLSPQKELILFRIFQELINNVIKHSNASAINVTVSCDEEGFHLIVRDNGKGFDISNVDENGLKPAGLGIRNIKNRAEMIGARLQISSNSGTGTTVDVTLPMAKIS